MSAAPRLRERPRDLRCSSGGRWPLPSCRHVPLSGCPCRVSYVSCDSGAAAGLCFRSLARTHARTHARKRAGRLQQAMRVRLHGGRVRSASRYLGVRDGRDAVRHPVALGASVQCAGTVRRTSPIAQRGQLTAACSAAAASPPGAGAGRRSALPFVRGSAWRRSAPGGTLTGPDPRRSRPRTHWHRHRRRRARRAARRSAARSVMRALQLAAHARSRRAGSAAPGQWPVANGQQRFAKVYPAQPDALTHGTGWGDRRHLAPSGSAPSAQHPAASGRWIPGQRESRLAGWATVAVRAARGAHVEHISGCTAMLNRATHRAPHDDRCVRYRVPACQPPPSGIVE